MIWTLLVVLILTVAAATLYQWGATLWKGNLIPVDQVKWLAVFLWISAFNFVVDALNAVLTLFGIGVPAP